VAHAREVTKHTQAARTTPLDEDPLDEDPLDEDPLDEAPVDEDPVDAAPVDTEAGIAGRDIQLRLLPGRTGRREWALDERTRTVGRMGVARAREILRTRRPPQPVDAYTRAS
jgi:hypothetical protein